MTGLEKAERHFSLLQPALQHPSDPDSLPLLHMHSTSINFNRPQKEICNTCLTFLTCKNSLWYKTYVDVQLLT